MARAGRITATTRGARIRSNCPRRRSPRGRGALAARPAACHPRTASLQARPGVASTNLARWCYITPSHATAVLVGAWRGPPDPGDP